MHNFQIIHMSTVQGFYSYGQKPFECGPYGFICETSTKLRLCEGDRLYGPNFLCPANTLCNEDSNGVCEDTVNYIEPALRGMLRCHHNERLADPSVPDCKGYILCVPTKNQFQAIKFKCTGNTIFNGITRTCSSPQKYKCPLNSDSSSPNATGTVQSNRRTGSLHREDNTPNAYRQRPIDCKNYKFSVRQEGNAHPRVAYFCPKRPAPGQRTTRCTVFSNHFCLNLERDVEDQFTMSTVHRKPRMRVFNI